MEVLVENPSEIDMGTTSESFQKFLESQRELFHSQVDQLQSIVVRQCELTGANPLSQEMAAGALSVKIGKRPRDLLNPKAVKYMQSIFAIKDAISKKESREISALFGITITQVRDFFSSQRSRVRKFVRLSKEKANRPDSSKEPNDEVPLDSHSTIPLAPVPLNSVGPPPPLKILGPPTRMNSVGHPIPLNFAHPPIPLNTVFPSVPLISVAPPTPSISVAPPAPLNSMVPLAPSNSMAPLAPSNSMAPLAPSNSMAPLAPSNSMALLAPSNSMAPLAPSNSMAPLAPSNSMAPLAPSNSRASPAPLNSMAPPVPLNFLAPLEPLDFVAPLEPLNPTAPLVPFNSVAPPIPLNSEAVLTPLSSAGPPVASNPVGTPMVGGAPSCSVHDEFPDIDDSEKYFVDNVFSWMRKEETFSGQVKLMEWILAVQSSSVLSWFLSKGGVMILARWLSQAAIEEQTSVLLVILKVLCHLPLHKALPVHMSAILQSVNRLRFYRAQDISNRARVLLSRWSKIFARSQALKKPNAKRSSSDMHNELLLKQSIGEIIKDETWQAKAETSEQNRKIASPQPLKLLPAPSDPNKKHNRSVSSNQSRERRKVQLVEQPGQKAPVRSSPILRAVPVNQSRPMSADDIQKAKMRAAFMQSKYGKVSSSSSGSCVVKAEGSTKPLPSGDSNICSTSSEARPKKEEDRYSPVAPEVCDELEGPLDPITSVDSQEPSHERCKRVQIQWHSPPEVRMNAVWNVVAGENSKEVEVQRNRNRREKELMYEKVEDIPPEPREPWDLEMDYDDSLTPEIPFEQQPDADGSEPSASPCENVNNAVAPASGSSQDSHANAAEPDLELLAVLLKNPELVFSLTSRQGGGVSSEDTVKLLDMIKTGAVSLPGNTDVQSRKPDEKVEVSLPSPTPSSNPSMSGWKPEVRKNLFSQREPMANGALYASPSGAFSGDSMERLPANNMSTQPQHLTANFTPQHYGATVQPLAQQFPAASNLNNKSIGFANQSSSVPLKRTERISLARTSFPHMPVQSQAHLQQSMFVEPNLAMPYHSTRDFENPGPVPDSWRTRQDLASTPALQPHQPGYHMALRVTQQHQGVPGPWERTEFRRWSREMSPTRSPSPYAAQTDLPPQPRIHFDQYRQQDSSSGYRDQYRHEDRRWRDKDRDRRY